MSVPEPPVWPSAVGWACGPGPAGRHHCAFCPAEQTFDQSSGTWASLSKIITLCNRAEFRPGQESVPIMKVQQRHQVPLSVLSWRLSRRAGAAASPTRQPEGLLPRLPGLAASETPRKRTRAPPALCRAALLGKVKVPFSDVPHFLISDVIRVSLLHKCLPLEFKIQMDRDGGTDVRTRVFFLATGAVGGPGICKTLTLPLSGSPLNEPLTLCTPDFSLFLHGFFLFPFLFAFLPESAHQFSFWTSHFSTSIFRILT